MLAHMQMGSSTRLDLRNLPDVNIETKRMTYSFWLLLIIQFGKVFLCCFMFVALFNHPSIAPVWRKLKQLTLSLCMCHCLRERQRWTWLSAYASDWPRSSEHFTPPSEYLGLKWSDTCSQQPACLYVLAIRWLIRNALNLSFSIFEGNYWDTFSLGSTISEQKCSWNYRKELSFLKQDSLLRISTSPFSTSYVNPDKDLPLSCLIKVCQKSTSTFQTSRSPQNSQCIPMSYPNQVN